MLEIKEIAPKLPTKYLRDFFAEKDLPRQTWELKDHDGTPHIISNDVVIEHMTQMGKAEAEQVGNIIRKIDFHNGDVNHFLKHLASALVNQWANN